MNDAPHEMPHLKPTTTALVVPNGMVARPAPAESLREILKLIDDGILVRNTDNDGDPIAFMRQGMRIGLVLKAAQEAVEELRE